VEFNPSKCQLLLVIHKHKPVLASYTIHGQTVEAVDSAKYLGLTIVSELYFNSHISAISKKASGTRAFLGCSLNAKTRKSKHKLITSMSSQLWNMLQVPGIHILVRTLTSWSRYRGMQPVRH